jgi:hypothetical protein
VTETISPAAESPHLTRPHSDAAALRAIDEAAKHLHDRAVKIRRCPEPGRQRQIQDCVDQILAKVDARPAGS